MLLWSLASWEVYLGKLKGNVTRVSHLILTLKEKLLEIHFDYSSSVLEALFDCSNDEAFGTFHEQFLEYLVANEICLACREKQYPYPDFLQYVIRPEINRYFRGLWGDSTEADKTAIFENLYCQYVENTRCESFSVVSTRVHAVYHICRFNSPKRTEFIRYAFNIEKHISVRLSLYFGAIKMGDFEKEQEFFELLINDPVYDEANRGYHLAYYSDAVMGDKLPFSDNLQCNWQGTLNAILRHFRSDKEGHYFLRRIELVTMERFIEKRGTTGPLTRAVINELSEFIENSPNRLHYPDFDAKVKSAFESLTKKYNSLDLCASAT